MNRKSPWRQVFLSAVFTPTSPAHRAVLAHSRCSIHIDWIELTWISDSPNFRYHLLCEIINILLLANIILIHRYHLSRQYYPFLGLSLISKQTWLWCKIPWLSGHSSFRDGYLTQIGAIVVLSQEFRIRQRFKLSLAPFFFFFNLKNFFASLSLAVFWTGRKVNLWPVGSNISCMHLWAPQTG